MPKENQNSIPLFLSDRGLSEVSELPEEMLGLYRFNKWEINKPIGDRDYIRYDILTSRGWVPPANELTVKEVNALGTCPNDISVFTPQNFTGPKQAIIDPVEIKIDLSEVGSVTPQQDTIPAAWRLRVEDIEYYIPENLDQESLSHYLRPTGKPALKIAKHESDDTNNVTEYAIELLIEWYSIERGVAEQVIFSVEES